MSELTEEHVAALARQAADLLSPGAWTTVAPDGRFAGERQWLVGIADSSGQYRVGATTPAVDALFQLIDGLSNDSSEGELTWGEAFPPCLPGHVHPANVCTDDRDVLLFCPVDETVVSRIAPAAAP